MLQTLRSAFELIEPGRRLRWLVVVALALLEAVLEVVGAGLVYLVIGLVVGADDVFELPLIGEIVDVSSISGDRDSMLIVAGSLAGFFLIRSAIHVFSAYVRSRVAENAAARLSARLVKTYLRMPYQLFLQRNSAESIRNAHQVPQQLAGRVFVPAARVVVEASMIVFMLVLLVAIAPLPTLLAVLILAIAGGILLGLVQPRIKLAGQRAHQLQRETLRLLQQMLDGLRDIRLRGKEEFFQSQYEANRGPIARAHYQRDTLVEFPRSFVEFTVLFFVLVMLAYSVISGQNNTAILPTLGLFGYAALRIMPSIQRIIDGLNSIRFATAPMADLRADLQMMGTQETGSDERAFQAIESWSELTVNDVSHQYAGSDFNSLAGVNTTIREGEYIGICGPTGGGKSTLVDVVTGLLEPYEGEIQIDGAPLASVRGAWQRSLGVVPQNIVLMDDTLRRNIAFGVADHQVDEDAVVEAVEIAQLNEFVDALQQGLDTIVGERGTRLSGGQRQRVAIARALYHRPQTLIFDEGTASLDNTTEALLMDAIDGLRGGHTVILVAHRLTTVRNCDRILLIEHGRISAEGQFEALLQESPAFRALAGDLP